jgi:molecular chaperone DnaK (HSP70)
MAPINLTKTNNYLPTPASIYPDVRQAIKANTYIGIDFGTSTTVVSYMVDKGDGVLRAEPFELEQPMELGGIGSHELVNSVLAWKDNKLLFGRDAYRLRQELFEGKNIFSSFKMRLGVDIGPTYPETVLKRSFELPYAIENASDAAREFFRCLRESITKAVKSLGLPEKLYYAVSVPASFEANQRRDLIATINDAGFPVTESGLIDEPNAAFLSYFFHYFFLDQKGPLLDLIAKKKVSNILVYDFGAGTCDVSILEIKPDLDNSRFKSRNRAISRFTALGGDDFDRAIAREILLLQLLKSSPDYDPELRHIEEKMIPRLMPAAEHLKVSALEWLDQRGISTLKDLKEHGEKVFSTYEVKPFKIMNHWLALSEPTMKYCDLAEILTPFLVKSARNYLNNHVFAPVHNAIGKANLTKEDLDAIIFIGGSSANPLVRRAVLDELPSDILAITPPDLRRHVSLGACYHSLCYHGLNIDMIQPITPENLCHCSEQNP